MPEDKKTPIGKVVLKHVDKSRGGTLAAIEPMNLFPDFPGLKRMYYISAEPPPSDNESSGGHAERAQSHAKRGGHYHKLNHEIMFAIKGAIKLILRKGDENSFAVLENKPEDSSIFAVYIPPGWWHEVRFLTPDAILGVLSSVNYEDIVQNHDDIREFPE